MTTSPMKQYQERDHDVVDYDLHALEGFPYALRGPALDEPHRPHGVIIGAGQSFGVLVRDPFAHKLTRETGLPFLNLAVGGSAPALYLQNPISIETCNRAAVCIVQVMSARGSRSTYFESRDGKNMLRPRGSALPFVPGDTAFQAMFEHEPAIVSRLVVSEIRSNWVNETIRLLSAIRVPKILLWFSKRTPRLPDDFTTYKGAAGVFPQFVSQAMIEEVKPFADRYVEVVTSRGMPNQLVNRFTGEPAHVRLGDKATLRSEDNYYPSPEMHEDAFAALAPIVKSFLRPVAVE